MTKVGLILSNHLRNSIWNNMKALILSVSNDFTTNKVIKWLQYFQFPFTRYNLDEKNDLLGINVDEFSAYWFRKGNLMISKGGQSFSKEVDNYLDINNRKILEHLEFKLSKKRFINLYFNSSVNKLIVLEIAKDIGLCTPYSKMLTKNEGITGRMIYKSINDDAAIYNRYDNTILSTLTQEYKSSDRTEFSPTLFQEKIEKKYELRIFYLDQIFFSMAIFSQQNHNTSLDYRNFDSENPNRTVSYKLPDEIEKKLILLMDKLNLKSGAIDMIVNREDEHYFLEVNPVGQLGMVSFPCNYNIEKEIVKYLINE